jgi:hypothetical protein
MFRHSLGPLLGETPDTIGCPAANVRPESRPTAAMAIPIAMSRARNASAILRMEAFLAGQRPAAEGRVLQVRSYFA